MENAAAETVLGHFPPVRTRLVAIIPDRISETGQ